MWDMSYTRYIQTIGSIEVQTQVPQSSGYIIPIQPSSSSGNLQPFVYRPTSSTEGLFFQRDTIVVPDLSFSEHIMNEFNKTVELTKYRSINNILSRIRELIEDCRHRVTFYNADVYSVCYIDSGSDTLFHYSNKFDELTKSSRGIVINSKAIMIVVSNILLKVPIDSIINVYNIDELEIKRLAEDLLDIYEYINRHQLSENDTIDSIISRVRNLT